MSSVTSSTISRAVRKSFRRDDIENVMREPHAAKRDRDPALGLDALASDPLSVTLSDVTSCNLTITLERSTREVSSVHVWSQF